MQSASTTLAPIEIKIGRTTVRLMQGDLTALPVDAFVFYAREDLQLGSGFGTAIQARGGDAIRKELEQFPRLKVGEAVMTTAGAMQAGFIIHACGPKFQEPDTEGKLGATMRAALGLADGKGLRRVAFPPMGAGFYGVPLPLCARVMLETIREHTQRETSLEEVIICVLDRREYLAFAGLMEDLRRTEHAQH